MKRLLFLSIVFSSLIMFSQEEDSKDSKSNLQVFTPSKLLNQGQWDVKFFNNLYTQTRSADSDGTVNSIARENYFTSTLEVFTGISKNNRVNIGGIFEFRSNSNDANALSVLGFKNSTTSHAALTNFIPSIKIQPFENIGNFSFQSSIHIPINKEQNSENGIFIDQTAWTFQNRFFYDYTFPSGDWQLFTELNTEYHFGDEESFADKTFVAAPGVFMSYFPSQSITVLGFVQHYQRVGNFTQDFTSLGVGAKYQLTQVLNLEALFSHFVRGTDSGLGESFNLGLRALF